MSLPCLRPERSVRRKLHLYPRFPHTSATGYCSTALRGRGPAGSGAPGCRGVTGERRVKPVPGHTLRLSEGHESKPPTGTITSSYPPSTLEDRFIEFYTYYLYSFSRSFHKEKSLLVMMVHYCPEAYELNSQNRRIKQNIT